MEIIEKSVGEIIEYDNNPRNNAAAVEAVAKSITEYGFLVPIVIDKSFVIIAGHTRKKAAELLGMKKIPCIMAEALTEEQIKAFRLADNKTAEYATWDTDALREELKQLESFGCDLSVTGFDAEEIAKIFAKSETVTLKNSSGEFDLEDFADEQFVCECPRCGFRFNKL